MLPVFLILKYCRALISLKPSYFFYFIHVHNVKWLMALAVRSALAAGLVKCCRCEFWGRSSDNGIPETVQRQASAVPIVLLLGEVFSSEMPCFERVLVFKLNISCISFCIKRKLKDLSRSIP